VSSSVASHALGHLTARLVRRSSLIWAGALGLMSFAIAAGYEGAYPDGSDRSAVVDLGANPGFRALIGAGHQLDTAGGFTAWRYGGPAVVIAAVWGYLTTTRLLRGEEEAGRTELVRAGAVTALDVAAFAAAATFAGSLLMALGSMFGMLIAGLALDGSILTSLSVVSGAWVFASLGVVCSQLLPTRRAAALTAGAMVVLAFLVRAIADARAGAQWLRWATPFGWSERVNAFDPSPTTTALAVPIGVSVLLTMVGLLLARRRDLGASVIADAVSRPPRARGLRSSPGLATRLAAPRLMGWAIPVVLLSFTMGSLAGDVGAFFESSTTFQDLMRNFGVDPSVPVRAFLGFQFTALAVVVVCYGVSEMAAAREEEASDRLDNLLVRAVGRREWLAGRIAVAVAGTTALSLLLGVATWVGTLVGGGGIGFGDLLGGGLNLIPIGTFFIGAGVLAFAVLPRATAGLGYGLVAAAFLIQLVGSAIKAPQWMLNLSPFTHVAPVPAVGVGRVGAVVLLGLGTALSLVAVQRFRARDLHGA